MYRKIVFLLVGVLALSLCLLDVALAEEPEPTVAQTVVDATSNIVSDTYDGVKVVASDAYDGIKVVISDLSSALQVPAEHVYAVLVRQSYIRGISGIFLHMLLFSIFIFATIQFRKIMNKVAKQKDVDIWKTEGPAIGFVLGLIAMAIDGIVIVCCMGEYMTMLLNPEYHAIHEILEASKGLLN